MNYLNLSICIIIGYLFGSIPTGYLYAKSKGINILEYGSKNPGSTNIGRALGKKAGLTVFALDILKVLLPIFLLLIVYILANNQNMYLYKDANVDKASIDVLNHKLIIAYTGMGAVLGHSYPIFLRFIGGKGISCSLATIICISPIYGIVLFLVYKIITKTTRYVSLGSITAISATFISACMLSLINAYPFNFYKSYLLLPAIFIIFITCIIRHKSNIVRLINGTESKISIDKSTEI